MMDKTSDSAIMGTVEKKYYGVVSSTPRIDAADWTNVQHGNCDCNIFAVHRESRNQSPKQ